ncbi:MAG: bacillithiol biosynthesis cysteine-adding enzyme BshC [Bryobacteraceae bacterium]
MEPQCIPHTLIPGTSALFNDYLYDFEKVAKFFPHRPYSLESFAAAAKEVEYPVERRKALVEALRPLNPGSANLERLAEPGTLAVVTGQQVGLFSGPAYTVYKAVTAAKLAHQLTQNGLAAVPVFWLATEDHDAEEVSHVWVFDETARPTKIEVTEQNGSGQPVGPIPLRDIPIDALREALGALPYADDVVALVERTYLPDATFGESFLMLLKELLANLDLIFIDPLLPAVRQISSQFLADAVGGIPGLLDELLHRNRDLVADGYHAQVNLEADSSLLFLFEQGKRVALRLQDGKFRSADRSYTVAELQDRRADLSPNALLRPVMQDYLFPTVAYVGGPAELAYMAQSQVIYLALLGRMPVMAPRNGFTLLDGRAGKLMLRYGLQVPELFDYQEVVRARIAAKLVPAHLLEYFSAMRDATDSQLVGLRVELVRFDPTLEAAARKSESKILYQLEKLKQKTAREAMRRDARATSEALYLSDLVYPHRHLQERLYSILPFLAKFGLDLPQRLLHDASVDCPDHTVRVF